MLLARRGEALVSSAKTSYTVIECVFTCPIYSIRPPYSFQVRESLPLPVGSTLYGALISGLLRIKPQIASILNLNGNIQDDYMKLNVLYEQLERTISLTSRLPKDTSNDVSGKIIVTSLSWRVIRYDRIVDKLKSGIDARKTFQSFDEGNIQPGMLISVKGNRVGIADAMIRTLMVSNEIIISAIMPSDSVELKRNGSTLTLTSSEIQHALKLIDRIGDTESLCSAVQCETTKNVAVRHANTNSTIDNVNTSTLLGDENKMLLDFGPPGRSSSYTVHLIKHNHPCQGLLRDSPYYATFALPLQASTVRVKGKYVTVYTPSTFNLVSKVNGVTYLKYKSPIDSTDVVHIYLPSLLRNIRCKLGASRRGRRGRGRKS